MSNRKVPPFALLRNIGMQLIFLALIGYLVYRTITSFTKRYVTIALNGNQSTENLTCFRYARWRNMGCWHIRSW